MIETVVISHIRILVFATKLLKILVEGAGDLFTERSEILLFGFDETEVRRFDRHGNFRAASDTIILGVWRRLIPPYAERNAVFRAERNFISVGKSP